MPLNTPPSIIAHRGAGYLAPENTLAALRKAASLGLHGAEFDVQMTSDHQLVVFHDTTLERTTDGAGLLAEKTLSHLKKLDAGSWFDAAYRDERIPMLQEVLDAIEPHMTAYLDIKDVKVVDRAIDTVNDLKADMRCVFISSVEAALIRHARRLPDASRALLVHPPPAEPAAVADLIRRVASVPADVIGVAPALVTPKLMAHCREAGIRVLTGPLDDAPTIAACLPLEPDLALSNRPDLVLMMKEEG